MLRAKQGLTIAVILTMAQLVCAQSFRIGNTLYTKSKVDGSISSIAPGVIMVKAASQPIQVVISDQRLAEVMRPMKQITDPPAKVSVLVSGRADVSFLARDQYVSFSADLDAGKGRADVTDLTLFTPSETQKPGISNTSGGEPSATGPLTGTFLVSGQVVSYGRGQLVVTAPTEKGRKLKISVSVPASAKLSLRASDLSYAQVGDPISAEGYFATGPNQLASNSLLASSIEVTLAKPLMSKARRRELTAADGPARRKPDRAAEASPPKNDSPLAGIAGFESTEPARKPGKAAGDGPMKDSDVRQRSDDPSPDSLIIVDAFVVDEDSSFDAPAENDR